MFCWISSIFRILSADARDLAYHCTVEIPGRGGYLPLGKRALSLVFFTCMLRVVT